MKVLNLGSLNIDITYQVPHVVAPGETIKATKCMRFCGGKGMNQSVALARAGADVFHAGCIGHDGEMLIDMLERVGVDISLLKKMDGPTGHAVIQVDEKGQNSIVIYAGANNEVTKDYIDSVMTYFKQGDLILLQNEISNVEYAIEVANEKGMKVALNPSPIDEKLLSYKLSKVDYFILNEIEGQQITGFPSSEPSEILNELKKRYPKASCVLTLGGEGAYYQDAERVIFQPNFRVKSVDTTCAGDTFTGFFLSHLVKTGDAEESMKLAAAAAALSVTKSGASNSIPTLEEVHSFIDSNK